MTPVQLLHAWLDRQLPEPARQWLAKQRDLLAGTPSDREVYTAVSLVARKLGKDDLRLDESDVAQANAARTHWDPRGWSVDQAGRILLLLSTQPAQGKFSTWLDQLCQTADVGELVAFYRGLPLYPDPEAHRLRAAEGVRSNMKAVFESVALRNPYPSEQLPEGAWNQMVLKALFVGSTLDPIVGLESRSNPALARMLCDYAHERWAAKRPVSPELWRCVGPHADASALADLQKVLETGTPPERIAAALSLSQCPDPQARQALARAPELERGVASGELTWKSVLPPG